MVSLSVQTMCRTLVIHVLFPQSTRQRFIPVQNGLQDGRVVCPELQRHGKCEGRNQEKNRLIKTSVSRRFLLLIAPKISFIFLKCVSTYFSGTTRTVIKWQANSKSGHKHFASRHSYLVWILKKWGAISSFFCLFLAVYLFCNPRCKNVTSSF